jgi:Ca2+-binding RTX toxin-like protein
MTQGIGLRALTKVGAAIALASLASLVYIAAANSGVARQPTCRGVDATIVGTNGADDIHGTASRDVIVAKGGADDIEGRGGNDLICAGSGNDHAEGDDGNDTILGNRGNDELEGDRGRDVLRGGLGFDKGDGGSGDDTCLSIERRESC